MCGRGGTIYTEAETYSGALSIARHLGLRLVGLAIDEEGMCPDALDQALAESDAAPKAVFVTPTAQNPTTSTMGLRRREDIVRVCRDRDAWIVEDDVYTLEALAHLPQLAALAPERTLYANSLSKTLNPALRIGGLVVPPRLQESAETVLQATCLMVSPLSCAVMEQWILDGTADTIGRAIQEEGRRRQELARTILGPVMRWPKQAGYHVWLPMPRRLAEQIDDAAQVLGIKVTPPASTAACPQAEESGIRLCLGTPAISDLTAALVRISGLLCNLEAGYSG